MFTPNFDLIPFRVSIWMKRFMSGQKEEMEESGEEENLKTETFDLCIHHITPFIS